MRPSAWVLLVLGCLVCLSLALPPSADAQGVVPGPPWGTSSGGSGVSPSEVLGIVADAGTLNRADRDSHAAAFVASGLAADGGVAAYAFMSNQDSKWKLGAGTQMELVPSGNSLLVNASDVTLTTAFIAQPACISGQTCRWYADPGKWFGIFPGSDTSGCASGTEGGFKANNVSHRLHYCDGTNAHPVTRDLRTVATLNFGSISNGGTKATLTATVAGATRGDPVLVTACDTLETDIGDVRGYVASADTVTVAVRNFNPSTPVDPAACDFSVVVLK